MSKHTPKVYILKICKRIVFYSLVIIACAISLFPIFWMITTSLQNQKWSFQYPPSFIPKNIQWNVYPRALLSSKIGPPVSIGHSMLNTFILASLTSILSLVVGCLAGYSLSRFRFRGKNIVSFLSLLTQMFPVVLLAIPIFVIFKRLGLVNSLYSLIIAYIGFLVPVSIFLVKGFFDSIPIEIEEAALIDGSSRLGSLFRIVLPLSAPGLMATFLFCFIIVWNEYVLAFTLIKNPGNWNASIGLMAFRGQYTSPWDMIMASAFLISLPVSMMFLFLQKYLTQGLAAGAVKA